MDIARYARHYTNIGLGLVVIPLGLKGPRGNGWNIPENAITTREDAHRKFSGKPLNMGLLHSVSGTATLDIDHEEWAHLALASIGVDLSELMAAPVRIKGKNSEKPLYRLPEGCEFDRRSLSWPHPTELNPLGRPKPVTVFELRAGAVQDVLPPSIHPDTGKPYEWAGQPPRTREDIPLLPEALRHIWENWDEYAERMKQACPWMPSEGTCKPQQPRIRPDTPYEGPQRPGDVFRERVDIRDVLERNGYKRVGDRYLPPASKTKVAGVRILRGDDGRDRAFSDHGSCPLNDDHAHDAFSALILLEHSGDVKAAARAAAAEMGMETFIVSEEATRYTVDDVKRMWTEMQEELVARGCMLLDAAQGNSRQKTSLFELWAALTELAVTNIWERRGKFYINPGGLNNLKGHGITGRPADIATRLRYLGTLGFHRGVTQLDPSDRSSALLIEIPASPRELPFMALTQEESKSLNISVPTHNQRKTSASKTTHKFTTNKLSSNYVSCELSGRFEVASQTVTYLTLFPDLTTAELAALRGKSVKTIRAHVRALKAAGLVTVEKRRVRLTGDWAQVREVLRLERENDPAFRLRVRKALEGTIRYCNATLNAASPLSPSQAKRRESMLRVATLRLERLDAGESISEVMKWAA